MIIINDSCPTNCCCCAVSQLARWSVQCTEALMMHFAIVVFFIQILESSDRVFLSFCASNHQLPPKLSVLACLSIRTCPFFHYRKVTSFIETSRGFAALLYCMFFSENHFFCPLWIGKFILKFIRHTLVRSVCVCIWHDDSAAPETFFLFSSFSFSFNCRQLKRQRRCCWALVGKPGKKGKKGNLLFLFFLQFVDAEKRKKIQLLD